ncbi:MAG TPA: hypothetical protein VGO37_07775, partial [Steroidobacteraceae bacterium]|nr:hypothetical protein [Steroidobacteraceae bacterium]
MRSKIFKSVLIKSGLAVSVLLLGIGMSYAQVNLTAAPAAAYLPDGTAVPMWGYSCGAPVAGGIGTCAPLNASAAAGSWSPVLITVQTGQDLTINLTNNLTFTNGSATTASIPTSLVIVGQLGGGLGTGATTTPSPTHNGLGVSWSTPTSPNTGTPDPTVPTFTPPPQGPRVQSFATEVAAGATTTLTWKVPRPGTYLIESGTHPSIQGPMGLYGILVVTQAPGGGTAGVAYPAANPTATAVSYNADVPLLLSEIDPVQNNAVNTA